MRMKRLIKAFSNGLAMWREWRTTGLLRGSMEGSVLVVAQWVGGCYLEGMLEENWFGCQSSKENGA